MTDVLDFFEPIWKAVRLEDLITRRRYFQLTFPQINGGTATITFNAEDTASMKIPLTAARAYEAVLPAANATAIAFLRRVIDGANATPVIFVRFPTFVLGGFIAGRIAVGLAKTGYLFDVPADQPSQKTIGDTNGTLAEWKSTVGAAALTSTYLTLAIEHSLSSFLEGYYRFRTGQRLTSECATFNIVGESGTGKTTMSRVCVSASGHPSRMAKWDFTRRGLEEVLAAASFVGLVVDDVEKHTGEHMPLYKAIAMVTQYVADGTSMVRSKAASDKNGVPSLSWLCNSLSSSPKPLAEAGRNRTLGEQVRLIEISAPSLKEGGTIDCPPEGADAIAFAAATAQAVEVGLSSSWGHLLPAFAEALMAADYTPRILKFVEKFVQRYAGQGNSWEKRFARKFAVLYAAGRLAVELGLLDWPQGWAWKATSRLYKRARAMTSVSQPTPDDTLKRLGEILTTSEATILVTGEGRKKAIKLPDGVKAIRTHYKEKAVYALFDDFLRELAPSKSHRKAVIQLLASRGDLIGGQGEVATTQLSIPIERSGTVVKKPRFLLIRKGAFK